METFLAILLIVGLIVTVIGLIVVEDGGEGTIVLGGVLLIFGLWGGLVKSLTSIDEIKTNKPIVPELRITVKDSVTIDTVYIYKIKDYKD